MKKLHLHIGSYKTGTTSIQNTLHKNSDVLKLQEYIYPGKQTNHHLTFLATEADRKDRPRQLNSYDENALTQIRHKYFSTLESDFKEDIKKYVISTEYLFISEKSYIQNYLDYFGQFFEEVKAYVFVRDPLDYYRSAQQQMIKARSFINAPKGWKLEFRKVIEAWKSFIDVEVIQYKKGTDSSKILCEKIGIDYDSVTEPPQKNNISLSVEQMLLLEKVQHHLYKNHENHFKNHLGIIQQVKNSFTHEPHLQDWVRPVIYQNHVKNLQWLKEEYGINFLDKKLRHKEIASVLAFESGKATVRDVYKVPSEESVEKYEALVVDALLKKLLRNG